MTPSSAARVHTAVLTTAPSWRRVFRSEMSRIRHRRVTTGVIAVSLFVVVASGVGAFVTHDPDVGDLTEATALAQENTAACVSSYGQTSGLSDEEIASFCYQDPAWFFHDDRFHLQDLLSGFAAGEAPWSDVREQLLTRRTIQTSDGDVGAEAAPGFDGTIAATGVLVAVVAAALAASYIGADWRSGVVESQLVREPSRRRLFAAKIAAATVWTSAMAVTFMVAMVITFLPSAGWRGDMRNTGTAFWLDVGATVVRVGFAAVVLALLASSIALLARSTAAGVASVLLAIVFGGVFGAIGGSWMSLLQLGQNLNAFVAQGDVSRLRTVKVDHGVETWLVASHSWVGAAGVLTAMAVAAMVIADGVSRRRDVS